MNLKNKIFAQVLGLIFICLVSFTFGADQYRKKKWPFNRGYINALQDAFNKNSQGNRRLNAKRNLLKDKIEHPGNKNSHGAVLDRMRSRRDLLGRLVGYPSKTSATCPQQDEETAVILLIGQSNIANHAAQKFRSAYGERIVNYFEGDCDVAESPFLGSTGTGGEWGTLLANNLVKQHTFNKVVLISSAISATSILKWQPGEIYNLMLLEVLADVKKLYKINYIIWHQGERDWNTLGEIKYAESLLSLVSSVRQAGVDAPFFVSTTTRCNEPGWFADNPPARAQMASRNKPLSVFPGVNSDKLLLTVDRQSDDCHLVESGQKKIAEEYAEIIHNHRLGLSDD